MNTQEYPALRSLLRDVTKELLMLDEAQRSAELANYHARWLADAKSTGKTEAEATATADHMQRLAETVLATVDKNICNIKGRG